MPGVAGDAGGDVGFEDRDDLSGRSVVVTADLGLGEGVVVYDGDLFARQRILGTWTADNGGLERREGEDAHTAGMNACVALAAEDLAVIAEAFDGGVIAVVRDDLEGAGCPCGGVVTGVCGAAAFCWDDEHVWDCESTYQNS